MRLLLGDCIVAAGGDTESDRGRVADSSSARLARSFDHLRTRPAGEERHVEADTPVGRMKEEDRNIEGGAVAGRRKVQVDGTHVAAEAARTGLVEEGSYVGLRSIHRWAGHGLAAGHRIDCIGCCMDQTL